MKRSIVGKSGQLLLVLLSVSVAADSALSAVGAPKLKWKYGGCYSSWCETGWYSSPAVIDLDGNGTQEVVASAYSIVALNGSNGSLIWRTHSGHDISSPNASDAGRTWPGIVVGDVDGDTEVEIVSAHGGGYVSVYDHLGHFKNGWPNRPTDRELRGLIVADLDNDGTAEIAVTGAVGSKVNTWVFEHDGSLRGGWPQLQNDSGYAYGVFNDNGWIADIRGDKQKEIVIPSDVHYICAYDQGGRQLAANQQYGGKGWGQIGLWESQEIELRGWGDCSTTRAERYRANLAHGAAVVADLDGNDSQEVVVTGNMYDCAVGHPPGKYTPLFIFNADRSRFNLAGRDWRTPAITGAPLSEDYSRIENCQPNPVVADLDGDGLKEILFSAYDGKLHSFWLDKKEHYTWPYAVNRPAEGFLRFSSEPAVVDLDGDGKAEVVFTSWVEKKDSGALRLGKVHILDYRGNVLHEINLPAPKSSGVVTNGALPAPTIADIDGDEELEMVINTVASGFVAYDLPGSSSASIQWRTGRNKQNFTQKHGEAVLAPLLLLLDN